MKLVRKARTLAVAGCTTMYILELQSKKQDENTLSINNKNSAAGNAKHEGRTSTRTKLTLERLYHELMSIAATERHMHGGRTLIYSASIFVRTLSPSIAHHHNSCWAAVAVLI